MELSRNQLKKQKRREKVKAENKILRKKVVLCAGCAQTDTLLQWKHNGYQCPNCNALRYVELT